MWALASGAREWVLKDPPPFPDFFMGASISYFVSVVSRNLHPLPNRSETEFPGGKFIKIGVFATLNLSARTASQLY